MRKTDLRKTWWILMLALLVVGTYGCRTMSEGTPDEVDPEAIESSIRTQVLGQYPGETFDFGISVTDAGVVTLSGTVDDQNRVIKIEELARSVSGVTRVINNLQARAD